MKTLFEHYSAGETLYGKLLTPVCTQYGLTRMELNVMLFLHHNPDCDTASQIVKHRRLTKSHVSMSVRSLEEKGLLTCAYRGQNRRTIHLTLTDAAKDMVEAGCVAQKEFTEVVFSGFSQEEREMLWDMIVRIDQNIEQAMK